MLTEIANTLTDDQVALLGCFVALLVTGTMMSLSFYVGRGARGESSRSTRADADLIPLAASTTAQGSSRNDHSNATHKDAA